MPEDIQKSATLQRLSIEIVDLCKDYSLIHGVTMSDVVATLEITKTTFIITELERSWQEAMRHMKRVKRE